VKGHENGKGLGESKGDKDGKGYEFRGDAKGERKGPKPQCLMFFSLMLV